jgi:nucleotide-binding universal stress UspA family protein
VAIERILLPTDFSESSVRAARVARELAEVSGATVHVLHVWRLVQIALPAPEIGALLRKVPPDTAALRRALDEFAQRHLSTAGVSFVTVLRRGKTAREIVRYARASRIDRIVIGTHGRGIMRRVVHGSVSKSVLEQAPCAVLMVPPAVALPDEYENGQWNLRPGLAPAP